MCVFWFPQWDNLGVNLTRHLFLSDSSILVLLKWQSVCIEARSCCTAPIALPSPFHLYPSWVPCFLTNGLKRFQVWNLLHSKPKKPIRHCAFFLVVRFADAIVVFYFRKDALSVPQSLSTALVQGPLNFIRHLLSSGLIDLPKTAEYLCWHLSLSLSLRCDLYNLLFIWSWQEERGSQRLPFALPCCDS